jgi:acetyl esterase
MALTRSARFTFAAYAALTRLRLMPTPESVLAKPMAKRLSEGPPRPFVGAVPVVQSEDTTIPTRDGQQILVRIYRPTAALARVPVLYLHGGGFVVGGLASCDHICRRLAHDAAATVISVEYRLAPEHRFPIPLEDAEDALRWVIDNSDNLGIAADALVIAGDSAGGNLAAALALRCRDQHVPQAGQILIYPGLDLTISSPGVTGYNGIGLTTEHCKLCATSYLADHDPNDPYASPLRATDFSGLPPTWILTVEHDPLRDEGAAYALRCRDAGIPIRHVDQLDHVHGSLSLPRLYRGVDDLYREMAQFISAPHRAATISETALRP